MPREYVNSFDCATPVELQVTLRKNAAIKGNFTRHTLQNWSAGKASRPTAQNRLTRRSKSSNRASDRRLSNLGSTLRYVSNSARSLYDSSNHLNACFVSPSSR